MAKNSIEKMSENKVGVISDKSLLSTLGEMWTSAKNYRDDFTAAWEEIANQINLNPPADWAEKEDWQTQIMTPEQFKIAETATANLMAMLFGSDKFFGLLGVDSLDKEQSSYLLQFMFLLFREGGFYQHNPIVIQEGCELGTSFIKCLVNYNKQSIDFSYRTVKDVLFDPESYKSFRDCKFYIEEYDMTIYDIMKESRFSKEGRNELLKKLSGKSSKVEKDLVNIVNAGGTEYELVESKYQIITLREFWGYVPIRKTKEIDGETVEFVDQEWRAITYSDAEGVFLQNEKSAYEEIPVERMICRRRRDHIYGYGYCYHLRGLQNYINSLINLGFDAAKIASMPMMKIDEANVPDPSSIEVKPLAKWNLSEGQMDAVELVTYNVNTMPDVLVSIQQADQLIQEASGINRYATGNDTLFGKGDKTLGQSQLKLQSAQRRTLKIAREVAEDYVIPLVEKVFRYITNPKFIKMFQEKADRVIGTTQEPNEQFMQLVQSGANPNELINAGIQPQITKSKLNLEEIGKMHLDFTPLSLINYIQKTEQLSRLEGLLTIAAQNPTIAPFINMDGVMSRWASMQEIDDYKELFTTIQQRQQALDLMRQQQARQDAMNKRHELMRDKQKAIGKIELQKQKEESLKNTREHEVVIDVLREEALGDRSKDQAE